MRLIMVFFVLCLVQGIPQQGFKDEQLRYPRVRTAYTENEESITTNLADAGLILNDLEVFIQIYKLDQIVELWGRNEADSGFILIKKYNICQLSGMAGPKRKQGDYQVPEGFYDIDRFNPASSFYLSLGLNYPNASDRILGENGSLGGDIFIHGNCVTIGCVPIRDRWIKELYVYCVEARNHGQQKIQVVIYPTIPGTMNYKNLAEDLHFAQETKDLWQDLQEFYNKFQRSKMVPDIQFLASGRHRID